MKLSSGLYKTAYDRITELVIMKKLNMIDYKTFLEQELIYYKDQVNNANEEIIRIQKELDEFLHEESNK